MGMNKSSVGGEACSQDCFPYKLVCFPYPCGIGTDRCWAIQGLTRHGKKNHDQDLYVCNLAQHPAFILHGDLTVRTLSL